MDEAAREDGSGEQGRAADAYMGCCVDACEGGCDERALPARGESGRRQCGLGETARRRLAGEVFASSCCCEWMKDTEPLTADARTGRGEVGRSEVVQDDIAQPENKGRQRPVDGKLALSYGVSVLL